MPSVLTRNSIKCHATAMTYNMAYVRNLWIAENLQMRRDDRFRRRNYQRINQKQRVYGLTKFLSFCKKKKKGKICTVDILS